MVGPIRYAIVFVAAGLLLARGAVLTAQSDASAGWWVLAVAEGYLALSFFGLAAGYLFNHWGLPVEALAERAPWSRVADVVALPYRLFAGPAVFLLHSFDSMAPMHEVAPRLYVGRLPRRDERARLSQAGVNSVLNVCFEFPAGARFRTDEALEIHYVPMLDGTAPSRIQFERAIAWVVARHTDGHTVLVHCAHGRGRSVTVAAAALCRLGFAQSAEEALARIATARPKVCPTPKQQTALRRFLQTGRAEESKGLVTPAATSA
jgi:predicted protein tyrosine phosphatase